MPHDVENNHVRPPGKQKSKFIGRSSVTVGSDMDFWTAGFNYRISYDNFIAGLGVTGSIVTDGDPAGTPILDVDGTVNKIRSIKNGAGIIASLSPLNSVEIKHNFQAGSGGGVDVLTNTLADSPIIRGLIAGTNTNISATNGAITISFTGGPAQTGLVVINSVTDFPDPVANVITLIANTTYSLQGFIDLGVNRLVVPSGVEMYSENRLTRGLTSDNAGAMLTMTDGGAVIFREMLMESTAGSIFAASGGGSFILNDCLVTRSAAVSTADAMGTVAFRNFSVVDGGSGVFGVVFTGAHSEFNASGGFCSDWTGIMFDFGTATFSRGMIIGPSIRMLTDVGNTAVSAAASSANIGTGATGLVFSSKFTGGGTFLVGVTSADSRWNLHNVDGLPETRSDGIVYMKGNATNTVIATQGVPVLVAGTWVEGSVSQFISTTAGRLTYDGVSDQRMPIGATLTIEPASGANVLLGAHIAVNGTPVAGSEIQVTSSSGNPASVAVVWQMVFQNGDFVEVFVSNEDGTTNVLVSQITFVVN